MNTDSTVVDTQTIEQRIAAVRVAADATLAQRRVADEEATLKRQQEEHARRMEDWDRPLTLIYQAVPEWAHAYMLEPQDDYSRYGVEEPQDDYSRYGVEENRYAPIIFNLPGCTTIAAWADKVVAFEAAKPRMYCDEEMGVWCAGMRHDSFRRSHYEIRNGETDWCVVVSQAHDNYLTYLEFIAEVERRNSEPATPAAPVVTPKPVLVEIPHDPTAPVVTPKPVLVEIPHDPTAKVLACIQELNTDADKTFERGVLYGLVAIAAELRGLAVAAEDATGHVDAVRAALDDIAAVVVANDPKANQENPL